MLDGKIDPGDEVVVTNPESLTDGAAVLVEQHNLEPKGIQSGPTAPQGGGAASPSQPQGGAVGTGVGGGAAVTAPNVQIPSIQPPATPASQAQVSLQSSDQSSSQSSGTGGSSASIGKSSTQSTDQSGVSGGLPNLPSLPSTGSAPPRATVLPDNSPGQQRIDLVVLQQIQQARPTATPSTSSSSSSGSGSSSTGR